MSVESFSNLISRWKDDDARQFERPYESLVLSFVQRVTGKDPTLQLTKLKSRWGYDLWLRRSQTSNANLIDTRGRTIRRLWTSEREDSNLMEVMWGTSVAGRSIDAATEDTS